MEAAAAEVDAWRPADKAADSVIRNNSVIRADTFRGAPSSRSHLALLKAERQGGNPCDILHQRERAPALKYQH